MKRLLLVLTMLLTFAVPGDAQAPTVSESLTIAAVVKQFGAATLAALDDGGAPTCTGVLETAPIRFTVDGTTPSASVGIPVSVGQQLTLTGYKTIEGFKGFRTTSTSGVIYFTCAR